MAEAWVLINGEIMPAEETSVSITDRGHLFGDGVFELVPVYNGRSFALLPHMNNLFRSVIQTKIPAVYTIEELIEFHENLLQASGMHNCEIYTQITRGSAMYGLAHPERSIPDLTMFVLPVDRDALQARRTAGVNLITEEDIRWQRCDINSLNRLPEIMARQKACISNAFDALFIRDGKITEAPEASFCILKDGVLWTHPENNFIHKNITRRLLQERLCPDLGLQMVERAFDKEFALKAEEAFLCGPRCEFMPVTKLDRTLIGSGRPGETTSLLQKAYLDFVFRECPLR